MPKYTWDQAQDRVKDMRDDERIMERLKEILGLTEDEKVELYTALYERARSMNPEEEPDDFDHLCLVCMKMGMGGAMIELGADL